MDESHNRRQTGFICLGLALAILAAYSPLWHCGFVLFDDNDYITSNDMVKQGLTWRGIVWAFTTVHASNWHPLTWISHMLDCEFYGMNPAGHHLTSLLLHMVNSILLFLLLQRMTRARWPSALVAALFALHPLHVESVVWISERKDVLSALFWILAVWAYVRYAETSARAFYLASLGLFALGLMAKPMLVTLPLVLILIDYWPLRRFRLAEKVPYFILAAASCVVTIVAQRRGGAMTSLSIEPLWLRLENVPIAYARYVQKTFMPIDLAAYYPLPVRWPVWEVAVASVLSAGITAWVINHRRAQPYLAVGWLWFIGMLLPVIGVVQVGSQAMADRYDYLPGVGLFIAIAWALRPRVFAYWGSLIVACCIVITWVQVHYWRDSETLFRHALVVTSRNSVMENDLGKVFLLENRVDDALPHLQRAVEFGPKFPLSHYNLGQALLAQGQVAEALSQFEIQVALQPNDYVAQFNFGKVLLDHGLAADAAPHFEKCLQLAPHHLQTASSLAWIRATNPDPALRNGARAVQLALLASQISGGNDPKILGILAAAYAEAGEMAKATETAQRALTLAGAAQQTAVAGALRQQLEFYRAGKPFRDKL
jgi:protein O-mannosyl-transferase